MRRWAIINVFLALIVALLGVQIARTWARALPPVEVTPRAPVPETAPATREKPRRGGGEKGVARAHQPPETLVAAIAEKDLLDPSRRAPSEETKAVEVVKETGPPPGITVVGVRIFGDDREVFVTDTTQGAAAQRRLRAGDEIAGYTVKTIEATSVTLSSPSGDLVSMPLALEKGKAPGTPAPRTPGRTPAQPGGSPAAGTQGGSPAAGVVRTPPAVPVPPAPGVPTPPVAVPGRPGQNPQTQQLPTEVRQKLERLKRGDKNPRMGEKP